MHACLHAYILPSFDSFACLSQAIALLAKLQAGSINIELASELSALNEVSLI